LACNKAICGVRINPRPALAHTPPAWIPGIRDIKECWQDYGFYIRSIPGSPHFRDVILSAASSFEGKTMKLAKWLIDNNFRWLINIVFTKKAKNDEMIRWGPEHGKYCLPRQRMLLNMPGRGIIFG